ncbi:MAG: hypothetical protein HRT89_05115 [Lentisphaeria bacterium]|nr:hypothetical protein [Lentisphaeria bacterium]NQZ67430.1 hypothetical protein [Lentisphaeria bacterium]
MLKYIIIMCLSFSLWAELKIDSNSHKTKKIDIPDPNTGKMVTKTARVKNNLDDKVFLRFGDVLHGNLESIKDGKLIWSRPDLATDIVFTTDKLRACSLFQTLVVENKSSSISLTNGDKIFGKLISMDSEDLIIDTWYSGKLTIPKVMITSIMPGSKDSSLIYARKIKLSDWVKKGSVTEKGGKINLMNNASIGKKMKLIDKMKIDVDVTWSQQNQPYFSINLFVNNISNYYRDGLNIKCNGNNLYLYQGQSRTLGQNHRFRISGLKAHVTIYVDKKSEVVALFIDGKQVKKWTKYNYKPTGTGLMLISQSYTTSFSRLKVRSWDGKIPGDSSGDVVVKKDTLYLSNGDKMSGEVVSYKDGKLNFKSFVDMPIPIKNINSIQFNKENFERARRNKGDVRLYYPDGAFVTIKLKSLADGKIIGGSENYGKDIKWSMDAFIGIEFGIYKDLGEGEEQAIDLILGD